MDVLAFFRQAFLDIGMQICVLQAADDGPSVCEGISYSCCKSYRHGMPVLSARSMLSLALIRFLWFFISWRRHVSVCYAAWSKTDFPELAGQMRSICDYSFDSTAELERFLFE